ncbi:MAG: SRPBCC family protein [Xanthomonadales bacterium]
MIARILLALVLALVLFLAAGFLLPRAVQVERSVVIERPPATVHGLVDGFATFPAWSPWMERDPAMQYTISEPASGVGARFEWRGDPRQVGSGAQEVVASEPYRSVELRIDSDQLGTARTRFTVERRAGGARLTWRYEADLLQSDGLIRGIFDRWFGLFYARWIARDLEQGLARLARLAATLPRADYSGLRIERVTVAARDIAYLTAFEGPPGQPVENELAAAYRALLAAIDEQGIDRSGQPLSITRAVAEKWRIDAAVPIDVAVVVPLPPVRFGQSPSGAAVRVLHRGPYADIAPVYGKIAAWLSVRGLREGGVTWEQYLSDPLVTPPEERETVVYVLLAE